MSSVPTEVMSSVAPCSSVRATIGGQKIEGELAGTSFCAEFRCGSCGMGLTGSLPSSKNRFATKKMDLRSRSNETAVGKHKKLDDLMF